MSNEETKGPRLVLEKDHSGSCTMYFASGGCMYTTFRDEDGRVTWTNRPGVKADDGIDTLRITEAG